MFFVAGITRLCVSRLLVLSFYPGGYFVVDGVLAVGSLFRSLIFWCGLFRVHIILQINKKVMGMIEKAETEYKELIHKKKVVENDKKKIEDVIGELDQKKIQTLQVYCTPMDELALLLPHCSFAVVQHGIVQCQT